MRSKCNVSTICSKNSTAEINIDDYASINKIKWLMNLISASRTSQSFDCEYKKITQPSL